MPDLFSRTLGVAAIGLLAACTPTGAPVGSPIAGAGELPQAAPLHQGGVVFLTAPEGGFAVGGRLVMANGLAPAAATVRLVLADGVTVGAQVKGTDGRFALTHVPALPQAPVAALHVEAEGFRGYVHHASGGEARRAWWRHAIGSVYDLGEVRVQGDRLEAQYNPLAMADTDGDGQQDHLDLDDDNDGLLDAHDADQAGFGLSAGHDPLAAR